MPNGSTDTSSKIRVLAWNLVGNVSLREDIKSSTINIEFTDKQFHKQIHLLDEISCELASLSYTGAFLASKAIQVNEDEYENESEDDIEDTKK